MTLPELTGEAPPDTFQEAPSTRGFARISVVLAAPPTGDVLAMEGQHSSGAALAPAPDAQQSTGHEATAENMRVFLELKASVPLQFGAAHVVNETRIGTHSVTVCSFLISSSKFVNPRTNCTNSKAQISACKTPGMHVSGTVHSHRRSWNVCC
jgi:hypothetical protein